MRKNYLILMMLFLISNLALAVDETVKTTPDNQNGVSDQVVMLDDQEISTQSTENEIVWPLFKKRSKSAKDATTDWLIPFLLGFLLGPIGLLIVFLVNLKKPDRKSKVRWALTGWLWWLVILGIILAAA
jgi:hypothetical protein